MKKFVLTIICTAFIFSSCQSKSQEIESQSIVKPERRNYMYIESKNKIPRGKVASPLTGLYIDNEIAEKRPIAVTINNLHKALPQSGISQADIYYEALAEGEITRIVAIFQNFVSEKIGPLRSTREYFACFALDNDAIYIHHGGSPTGYSFIEKRNIDNLDGMTDTTAFWRDKQRANIPNMYEHSSYVDSEGVLESIENRGYRKQRNDTSPMFSFNINDEQPRNGIDAVYIKIPFSYYQISEFKYNEDTKLYERYQSGTEQIDEETGEVLTVKNVIIQYADTRVVDNEGRREIKLVGEGTGQFISDGKAIDLKWEKEKYDIPTKWYDSYGNELKLNKGKTWICVCPTNQRDITFE